MTRRICIVVADASRARLFVHERETIVGGTRDELIEHDDLVNPARRLTNDKLLSDTRVGSNRAGDRHFGFDDHRDAHLDALDDAFAREIAQRFIALAKNVHASRLVLCASPHMLGRLRQELVGLDGWRIDEIAKDLVKLAAGDLRSQLADYGVLVRASRRVLNQRA
ncbi:MAG: host attachment protein [Kofleriaceae bacterium]